MKDVLAFPLDETNSHRDAAVFPTDHGWDDVGAEAFSLFETT